MEDYTGKTNEDLLELLEDLNEQNEMFEDDLDDPDYKMMYDKNAEEIIKIKEALNEEESSPVDSEPMEEEVSMPVEAEDSMSMEEIEVYMPEKDEEKLSTDLDQNTLDEIEEDEREFAEETGSTKSEQIERMNEQLDEMLGPKPTESKREVEENLESIKFSDIQIDKSLFFAKGGKTEIGIYEEGGDIKNGDVVMVKEPNYGYNADYYVVDDKAGYDEDGYLLSDTMKRESSVFEKENLEKIYAKGGVMDSRRDKDKEFDRAQEMEVQQANYDRLNQDDKEKLKMIQQMMAKERQEQKEKENYAKGGSIRRTNISPLLRYTNFEDGWIFNLVKLNPKRNQDGLNYKGNYEYGISRQGPGKKQEVWQYATLKEANKKYDELLELGKTYSKIKTQGNINKNYEKGGKIDKNLTYKGNVIGFKDEGTGRAFLLGEIDIPKNSTFKSIIELAKSKFKRTWFVEVSKDGEYLYEIADDSYKGEYPMVTSYAIGGALELVHAYDDDGSLFGTGNIEKVEGGKTYVRFDSQKVKAFDNDKVKLVMKKGGLAKGYHKMSDGTIMKDSDHYARGGEVTYTDTDNYANRRMGNGGIKIWENYKNINNQKAVGSFSHTYNKRNVGDYYLFLLDDYDRNFYSHIALKPNEMLFRNETESGRISKSLPLIKINIKNGRVYFLSEENDYNSDIDDKNPKFSKASVDVNYLSLDDRIKKYNQGLITPDELSESVDKTYAKGGKSSYTKEGKMGEGYVIEQPYFDEDEIYYGYINFSDYIAGEISEATLFYTEREAKAEAKDFSDEAQVVRVKLIDDDSDRGYTLEAIKYAKGGKITGAGKSGLDKIKKTSKDNPSQMYKVTDDNYSNIGNFYLKNGKFAKKTVSNADYDFAKNKVSLRPKSDVIYKATEIEGKGGYFEKGGEVLTAKYKAYLDNLRDSGETNMLGAGRYLQQEFGLDKREARKILAEWMGSFAKGGEVDSWEYKWEGHRAIIHPRPRGKEYGWYVSFNDGYDSSTDLYNDIDIELATPLEAENNMFRNIYDRRGSTPERQISTYEKGGETASPITNYKKNIMGTLSFDLKVKGMRKPQDFIVYPITEKTDKIRIQSDKKFGEIHLPTGNGVLSKSGNTSWHLASDMMNRNINKFELSESEMKELKDKIKATTGKSVGSSFVKSDNSGAELLAEGGKLDMGEVDIYEGVDGDCTVVMHGDVFEMNQHTMPNMSIDMYSGSRSEYPADISHWGKKIDFKDAPIVIKDKVEARTEEFKKGGKLKEANRKWSHRMWFTNSSPDDEYYYENNVIDYLVENPSTFKLTVNRRKLNDHNTLMGVYKDMGIEPGSTYLNPKDIKDYAIKNNRYEWLKIEGDRGSEVRERVIKKYVDRINEYSDYSEGFDAKELLEQIQILESMAFEEKDEEVRDELRNEANKMRTQL